MAAPACPPRLRLPAPWGAGGRGPIRFNATVVPELVPMKQRIATLIAATSLTLMAFIIWAAILSVDFLTTGLYVPRRRNPPRFGPAGGAPTVPYKGQVAKVTNLSGIIKKIQFGRW